MTLTQFPPLYELCVCPSPSSLPSIAEALRGKNVSELIAESTCRVLLVEALVLIQKATSITGLPLLSILHYGYIKAQQIQTFRLISCAVVL